MNGGVSAVRSILGQIWSVWSVPGLYVIVMKHKYALAAADGASVASVTREIVECETVGSGHGGCDLVGGLMFRCCNNLSIRRGQKLSRAVLGATHSKRWSSEVGGSGSDGHTVLVL